MAGNLYFDFQTDIYDAAALCIPRISGLNFPSNKVPDNLVSNGHVIYTHLTTFNGPDAETVETQQVLPIMTNSGLSYGGQIPFRPAISLPKLVLEGFIDTPSTQIDNNQYFVSQIYDIFPQNNQNVIAPHSYGEIIAMMFEGRADTTSEGEWKRVDPLWFRDPYGRVYNNPRIVAYTGQYVVGTPERTQFTMTLKV